MTIERHPSPGQPIEAPAPAPRQAQFENLADLTNMLLRHREGDVNAVVHDLIDMAAAVAAWRVTVDEGAAVLAARHMIATARRLDPDAARAPGGLQ